MTRILRLAIALAAVLGATPHADEGDSAFLAALQNARGDLAIKLEISQCADAARIEPALRENYPDHPFFLLWPEEATLVDFLCGRWDSLLDPSRYSFDHAREHLGKFGPTGDGSGQRIIAQFRTRRERMEAAIRAGVGEAGQREFLLLYLESLFNRMAGNDEWIQHGINLRAEKWLERNPASPFRAFVKKEIQYVRVASPYGFGASLLSGAFLPMGRLGENLNRTVAFGFSLEFLYRKAWIRGSLASDIAPWLERNMTHDSLLWQAGGELSLTTAEVQVGAEVHRSARLGLEPFLSYGVLEMINEDVNDSLVKRGDDRGKQLSPVLGVGLQGNYWFGKPYRPQSGYLGAVLGYRFLRMGERFPDLEGDEIYLEIHLGARLRRQMRKF